MTRSLSIASVTVATNAAKSLPRQLDGLLRQNRSLDELIIVDNASTDNTSEMLAANYPQVTVLSLASNVGVGGGFSAGLTYAVTEKQHDWVWLLDDDSVPADNALAALLDALKSLQDTDTIGVLASLPKNDDTQLAYPGLLWRRGFVAPHDVSDQPAWFVDAVISSGSLLRAEAVKAVGLPRADFFMDFVDFEYCLRLRRHNYKIAVVRDSRLEHAIGNPRNVGMFGFSRPWTEQPPWREYYASRNFTYTVWTFYPDWKSKVSTVRRLLRHAAAITAFGRRKRACLKMMLAGFVDGRAGRLGIRIVPPARSNRTMEPKLIEAAPADA